MNTSKNLFSTTFEILFCLIIIAFGIFLRTKAYFANLPFWVDEEALILNGMEILKGNEPCFRGLAAEYSPPMFFLFARVIYHFYGLNEMALRVIPYIASIVTLPLFAFLSKKVIKTPFLFLLPLFYIAINSELIFNSQYFKFYSTDFLAVVAISLIVFYLKKLDKKNFLFCTFLGAIFAWSGLNPIFYLTGISIGLFFAVLKNSTIENWKRYIIFSCVWASFAGIYVYEVLTRRQNMDYLISAWSEYGNFFPRTFSDFSNLLLFHTTIGTENKITLFGFTIVLLFGLFLMLRKYGFRAILFISPVFVMLFLALLGKFPFLARQTLCLMPIWLLCITKSLDVIEWKSINKYLIMLPIFCLFFLCSFFKIYNLDYINQIITNPDYYRMSSGKEFYEFLKINYKDDSKNVIYILGRDESIRLYDFQNKIINYEDIFDCDDFSTFLGKIDKEKNIHIYIVDYPYIGTTSSENYLYIQNNCEIIKEVDDGYGKYVIFKKKHF